MSGMAPIYLMGWQAVADGLVDRAAWRQWAESGDDFPVGDSAFKPAVDQINPRVRRRLTPLTRLVVDPFFSLISEVGVDGADVNTVFASAHGEIGVLEGLLGAIHNKEALSPIDFCHSVHHTPTAYISMICGNQRVSRTVSAGARTVEAGLLESAGLLATDPKTPVALLLGDLAVPEIFGSVQRFPGPYGAVFLFCADPSSGTVLDVGAFLAQPIQMGLRDLILAVS